MLNWIGIGVGLLPALWFLYQGANGYAQGYRAYAVPSLLTGIAMTALVLVARLWRYVGPTLMIAAALVAPLLGNTSTPPLMYGPPEAFNELTFVYCSLPLIAAAVLFLFGATVQATSRGSALNAAGIAIAVLPASLLWLLSAFTPQLSFAPVADWQTEFICVSAFAALLLVSWFWRPYGTNLVVAIGVLMTLVGLVYASNARWIEQDARYGEITFGLLPVFLASLPLGAASLLFRKAHRLEHPQQAPLPPLSPASARRCRVAAAALGGLGIAIGVFAVFAWVYPLLDFGVTGEWFGAAYCFGVGFGFLVLVVIGRLGRWIGPAVVVTAGVALLLTTGLVELGLPLVVVGIFFLGAWSFRERIRKA